MPSGPFDFHGLNLVRPVNRLASGQVTAAVNIRAYTLGGITFRNLLTNAILTLAAAVHSIRRLNDATNPVALPAGYILINGAGAVLYAGSTAIGTGFSTNPLSIIPFRPNASVTPYGYVGDSAQQGNVTLTTQYLNSSLAAYNPTAFVTNGMCKVRSDKVVWKSGIKEPQVAPVVTNSNSSITSTGTLEATAIPWTNFDGANAGYNYGESHGYPNTGPVPPVDGTIWFPVNVENASSVTINSITGVANINGNAAATPTTLGPSTGFSTNPGHYVMVKGTGMTPPATATVVIGAFTDGSVTGIVIPAGVAPLYIPAVVDVGAVIGVANAITVPYGATTLQIGINSTGNTFNSNSGSFTISVTVQTNALPQVTSILGSLTADYWGDSPNVGPVSAYIWKNPSDPGGSGPTRTISDAVGSTSGNSFIFDATFTAGIPALPGVGTGNVAMQWTILTPESVASGTNAVYATPITNVYPNPTPPFGNFNFCLTGNIYLPTAGYYTFVLTSHDDCIWGIGGGVTLSSATAINSGGSVPTALAQSGQTITVANGLPLLPRGNNTGSNDTSYVASTVVIYASSAGIYPIEIDYDYWDHLNRILLLEGSPTASVSATPSAVAPTIIPPLPANVRQEVQYRYVYRSTATGATSNPSPESAAESVPVTSNTVTSLWSNDPQVDVVDYYRIDSVTASFTYVATGPNDNSGNAPTSPGTNTPISDSLLDTELGSQLLNYDNFEPFPSIDLPQKGICNVSGGVITWVSGGAIGGTAQGFNPRWLAGTTILIGSPTSLAYVLIARPTPAAFAAGTTYALNWIILDPSGHYQLVTVGGVAGGAPVWNDSGGTTTTGAVTFQDFGFFVPTGYVSQITIPGVPDGTNLAYQIPEPILANQPLPIMFGITDNVNFVFGVQDPIRPGTLYWCNGSNLDAAADTNQLEVTSPDDALMGGDITKGLGVVFSISRAWLIIPNFFNALATVTGTEGSTWSLQESSITRGLYMPWCVAVEGGGNIFFRVSDGIHVSPGGAASISITDEDLYPIFPHESSGSGTSVPVPVVRNGTTIYPPNDSLPALQRFKVVGQFLYYAYQGTDGNPHVLVYDINNHGWIYDLYNPPATCFASNEGQSIQGTLVGCEDGTIRQLVNGAGGVETVTGIVASAAFGGKGYMHCGMAVVEYSSTAPVTLSFFVADTGNNSYAPLAVTLPSTNGQLAKYFFKPSAAKWKLLIAQFSSTVTFTLNFQGTCFYLRAWGSSGEYAPTLIFGGAGGEG